MKTWEKFKKYGYKSTAEMLADRDHPVTRQGLIEWHLEEEGRVPTEEEINIMRPDSQESVNEEMAYYAE